MTDPEHMMIFDRKAVSAHRDRAAKRGADYNFLLAEVADRMLERLEEINRDFKSRLQLGSLAGDCLPPIKDGITISSDLGLECAKKSTSPALVCDEESLPFAPASFDLIFSPLCLHWVNDLPGTLIQINKALKPDGMFLGAIFGGDTLKELRQAVMLAESELSGGVSPRISPFADVRDLGSLLQRAGFALPVADTDTITVDYENPMRLLDDLRGMGESNAIIDRVKKFTPRSVLMRACEIYMEQFARRDDRGRISVPATFQIIYMTGWHPHESQQQPLKPGSAKSSLAAALNTPQTPNE